MSQNRFVKKPIVVEAIPVAFLVVAAATDWELLPVWFRDAYDKGQLVIGADGIHIHTLEGNMFGGLSDMLIRGAKYELYPCKLDIFEATYEPWGT